MKRVKDMIIIGKKRIGKDYPVFIIAEAGVNHNGSLQIALKLVDAAAKAGADAIKFQTFKAEQVATPESKMASYQKKNIGKQESQLEMLKKLELKEDFYAPIIKRCHEKNIIFLSTPHGGFESVDFLKSLNVPAFKFGSGDINNFPVLEYAAKFNKPMIIGAGMASMKEAACAIAAIQKAGNKKIIVLHSTSNYPTFPFEVNLRAMQTMMKELGVLVGYSDHTLGIQIPIMAATLGASIIEKHFTLDRKMSGPDHKASLEPKELRAMVKAIRDVEIIMGSHVKQPVASEKKHKLLARKSIVAAGNIKKGVKIKENMLAIKRPGKGTEPRFWNKIIGKKTKKNLKKDQFIVWRDLI
ncbi:MAG: N-acetylneuraminate synthase [Candidatus Niyogibacteria bacterium]|nr:N-acetylneuraminate synthase [Candidatus Niyogibacteria bacterium]